VQVSSASVVQVSAEQLAMPVQLEQTRSAEALQAAL
jgi:hypothetical protein